VKNLLTQNEFVIFTTRDYANAASMALSSASRQLARYAKHDVISQITKGVWANTRHPYFTPLACVPYLLGKEQGYVSFLTALHLHGVLSQIPSRFHIATTGHTRRLDTPVGNFDFIRMKPELMRDGVVWSETRLPFQIANVEKALLDSLYISTRKANRFSALPELELSAELFDRKSFDRLLHQFAVSSRIKNAMQKRFLNL
jgi:predicted transcriptional regulator of viral defense system